MYRLNGLILIFVVKNWKFIEHQKLEIVGFYHAPVAQSDRATAF